VTEEQKTQYQVAKDHIAKLESLVIWYETIKPESKAHIGICPHCGRDCVVICVEIGIHKAVLHVDDAQFYGTKWQFTKYCRSNGERVDIL